MLAKSIHILNAALNLTQFIIICYFLLKDVVLHRRFHLQLSKYPYMET